MLVYMDPLLGSEAEAYTCNIRARAYLRGGIAPGSEVVDHDVAGLPRAEAGARPEEGEQTDVENSEEERVEALGLSLMQMPAHPSDIPQRDAGDAWALLYADFLRRFHLGDHEMETLERSMGFLSKETLTTYTILELRMDLAPEEVADGDVDHGGATDSD